MTDQRIAERQRLQALYRSMLTEELLDLCSQGGLTQVAYDVRSEVLSERGVVVFRLMWKIQTQLPIVHIIR